MNSCHCAACRSNWRASATFGAGIFLAVFVLGQTSPGAERPLQKLFADVQSDDALPRSRAQVELRNRGVDALEPLSELLVSKPGKHPILESLFKENLALFLDEMDDDVLSLTEDRAELTVIEKELAALTAEKNHANLDARRERLKSLKERVGENAPTVEEHASFLRRIVLPGLSEVLRRLEFVDPILFRYYETLFEALVEQFAEETKALTPGSPEFEDKRYLLSPLWIWEANIWGDAGKLGAGAAVEERLRAHVDRSFGDLQSPDVLTRERAENEFYILRGRGLQYLREKRSAAPAICDRLVELLDWRIYPRTPERTSLDFRGYRGMSFRQRREHVIRYARTAGRDAIPTLRLLVVEDSREPSVRVKLTAAEQLAGLRDNTGIVALTKRPVPELMKIPEISRDFFILKGLRYQEEKKYALAIAEFQKILEDSPFHFQANYRIAFAYLLSQQHKRSIHHFEVAHRIQPNDALTLYNLGCAYALDGQVDKALDMLEAAVKAGFYDVAHLEKDPDFDSLRANERYQRLVDDLKRKAPVEKK